MWHMLLLTYDLHTILLTYYLQITKKMLVKKHNNDKLAITVLIVEGWVDCLSFLVGLNAFELALGLWAS